MAVEKRVFIAAILVVFIIGLGALIYTIESKPCRGPGCSEVTGMAIAQQSVELNTYTDSEKGLAFGAGVVSGHNDLYLSKTADNEKFFLLDAGGIMRVDNSYNSLTNIPQQDSYFSTIAVQNSGVYVVKTAAGDYFKLKVTTLNDNNVVLDYEQLGGTSVLVLPATAVTIRKYIWGGDSGSTQSVNFTKVFNGDYTPASGTPVDLIYVPPLPDTPNQLGGGPSRFLAVYNGSIFEEWSSTPIMVVNASVVPMELGQGWFSNATPVVGGIYGVYGQDKICYKFTIAEVNLDNVSTGRFAQGMTYGDTTGCRFTSQLKEWNTGGLKLGLNISLENGTGALKNNSFGDLRYIDVSMPADGVPELAPISGYILRSSNASLASITTAPSTQSGQYSPNLVANQSSHYIIISANLTKCFKFTVNSVSTTPGSKFALIGVGESANYVANVGCTFSGAQQQPAQQVGGAATVAISQWSDVLESDKQSLNISAIGPQMLKSGDPWVDLRYAERGFPASAPAELDARSRVIRVTDVQNNDVRTITSAPGFSNASWQPFLTPVAGAFYVVVNQQNTTCFSFKVNSPGATLNMTLGNKSTSFSAQSGCVFGAQQQQGQQVGGAVSVAIQQWNFPIGKAESFNITATGPQMLKTTEPWADMRYKDRNGDSVIDLDARSKIIRITGVNSPGEVTSTPPFSNSSWQNGVTPQAGRIYVVVNQDNRTCYSFRVNNATTASVNITLGNKSSSVNQNGCVFGAQQQQPPQDFPQQDQFFHDDFAGAICTSKATQNECTIASQFGAPCFWNFSGSNCATQSFGQDLYRQENVVSCNQVFTQNICNAFNTSICAWNATISSCRSAVSYNATRGIACASITNATVCSGFTLLPNCCAWNGSSSKCEGAQNNSCFDRIRTENPFNTGCHEARTQADCTSAASTYQMPCEWQDGFCEFKADNMFEQGAAMFDRSFDRISSEASCIAAGGFWKQHTFFDPTGNTKTDDECEMGYGNDRKSCNDACFACEQNGSTAWSTAAQAESACKNSNLGFCRWRTDSHAPNGFGICEDDNRLSFFGNIGSCDADCKACEFTSPDQVATKCQNSQAGCTMVTRKNTWGTEIHCESNLTKSCTDDCRMCFIQGNSSDNNTCLGSPRTCEWESTYRFCKPVGQTVEFCADGIDNDNDGSSDCKDSDCFNTNQPWLSDPACGSDMFKDFKSGARNLNTFFGADGGDFMLMSNRMMEEGGDPGRPIIVGTDQTGDATPSSVDMRDFGLKDKPKAFSFGITVSNVSGAARCRDILGASGTDNVGMFVYMDSDNNPTNNCRSMEGNFSGFEFYFSLVSEWNGSNTTERRVAKICANNTWQASSIVLSTDYRRDCQFIQGISMNVKKSDLLNYNQLYNVTVPTRLYVTTAGANRSASTPSDVLDGGPVYYTPGAFDIKRERCDLVGVDFDGDNITAEKDPDCSDFLRYGYVKLEQGPECRDGTDNDQNGQTDCADQSCFFDFGCRNTVNFTSDKRAPSIKMQKDLKFPDALEIKWVTDEASTGLLELYNDLNCTALNTTVTEPYFTFPYTNSHKVFLDQARLGFALSANRTYYYKYAGADQVNNTYKSACLNATTTATATATDCPKCFPVLDFAFTAPVQDITNPRGKLNLRFDLAGGASQVSMDLSNSSTQSQQINYSQGQNTTIVLNNPSSSVPWEIQLVGVDITSTPATSFSNLSTAILYNQTNGSGGSNSSLIGMSSAVYTALIQEWSPERVRVKVVGNGTKLYHYAETNISDRFDVTTNATRMGYNSSDNTTQWELPSSLLGFSLYGSGDCNSSWSCSGWGTCTNSVKYCTGSWVDGNSCGVVYTGSNSTSCTSGEGESEGEGSSGSVSPGSGGSGPQASVSPPAPTAGTAAAKAQFVLSNLNQGANKVKITDANIPVSEVVFTLNKAVGTLGFTVAALEAEPTTVNPYSGTVYKYLEIATEAVSPEKVTSVVIRFSVPKAWLTEKSLSEEDVILLRNDNGWKRLVTQKEDSDDTVIKYWAGSPGFSVFAIAAKPGTESLEEQTAVLIEEEVVPETTQPEPEPEQQPPTETKEVPESQEGTSLVWWIGILVVLLVLGVLFFTSKKKGQQKKEAPKKEA